MSSMISVEDFDTQVVRWLEDHRSVAPRDYGAILPPDLVAPGQAWQRAIFEAGFAGIHWPVEAGGQGLTPAHTGVWIRACAHAQVPPFLNMVGNVLTAGALLTFGTPVQQREHLPSILDGSQVWCQLFSEPNAGSDLAGLSTRAVLDGQQWTVDGQKVWCSNGRVADRGILLARTDGTAKPHRGISFFLVDMHAPGVTARALRQMNGGTDFDEVFFDAVRIDADQMVGPIHEGWSVAMGALTNERGYIGASGISMQRRLDAMIAHSEALDVVELDALMALWIRGTALWAMGQRQGPVASVLASIAKLGTTELMFDSAVFRSATQGADAMLSGPVTDGLLSAPGARIAGGTSQIQRNIIAERILGLPK